MKTTIPFSGFYDSLHSEQLDRALGWYFNDDSGDSIDALTSKAYELINWKSLHSDYAEYYTQCFAGYFGLDSLRFELLDSPKYYNYETERIFCTINKCEVKRLFNNIDKSKLNKLIKEHFTSCSGFYSYYPNELSLWGKDLSNWDHNQVGILIAADVSSVTDIFSQLEELKLIVDGYEFFNLLIEKHIQDKDLKKLNTLRDYLIKRANRIAA